MMKKRKIGAVTVGQSPRTDITTDADMVIFRKDFLILAGFYIWEVIFLR